MQENGLKLFNEIKNKGYSNFQGLDLEYHLLIGGKNHWFYVGNWLVQ